MKVILPSLFLVLSTGMLSAQQATYLSGFAAQLHVGDASSWTLIQIRPDGFASREDTLQAAPSLGIRVVFPGTLGLRPMLEYNATTIHHGYTDAHAGVEWNGHIGGKVHHVIPVMTLALGRVKESGGVSFTQIAGSAGFTFRIRGLVGGRAEVEYGVALNPEQHSIDMTSTAITTHIKGDVAKFLLGVRIGKF